MIQQEKQLHMIILRKKRRKKEKTKEKEKRQRGGRGTTTNFEDTERDVLHRFGAKCGLGGFLCLQRRRAFADFHLQQNHRYERKILRNLTDPKILLPTFKE